MTDETDPKKKDADGATAAEDPSAVHEISPDPDKPVEAEPAEDSTTPASKGLASSNLTKILAAAIAAVVLIAAVTVAVIYFLKYSNERDTIDAQESARQAICAFAPTLASYSADNIDEYFKNVEEGSTGDFKTQFTDSSKDLREVLVQGQVKSEVNDVQCGITSGDENQAEAVVIIGQTITSVGTQNRPQPGQLAMVATLEQSDGRWLVSKLDSPLLQP